MTLAPMRLARNSGAPAERCRRTMISAWLASRTLAVSLSVSPFVRLEAAAVMLTMSALSRLAASSKEMRVRVLGSMKRLTNVLPCRAGTFLTSLVPTCLKASAVSRTKWISSADSSRRPNKSLRVQLCVLSVIFFRFQNPHSVGLLVDAFQTHPHAFSGGGREILRYEIRADWQLAVTAVD